MQKRKLGRTDLSIAPVVFGGNVFGWTADATTSFDLLDRFSVLVFSDDHPWSRPRPEPFLYALSKLGCSPMDSVHVGDLAYDVLRADRWGCLRFSTRACIDSNRSTFASSLTPSTRRSDGRRVGPEPPRSYADEPSEIGVAAVPAASARYLGSSPKARSGRPIHPPVGWNRLESLNWTTTPTPSKPRLLGRSHSVARLNKRRWMAFQCLGRSDRPSMTVRGRCWRNGVGAVPRPTAWSSVLESSCSRPKATPTERSRDAYGSTRSPSHGGALGSSCSRSEESGTRPRVSDRRPVSRRLPSKRFFARRSTNVLRRALDGRPGRSPGPSE